MTHTNTQQTTTIEGVEQLVIQNYFETINRKEFTQTAALFVENGELHAPFTKPIVGEKAIALYLLEEASGMKLFPLTAIVATTEQITQVNITGKVKTALFTVNVGWNFTLNTRNQISKVKIKLLASPQ